MSGNLSLSSFLLLKSRSAANVHEGNHVLFCLLCSTANTCLSTLDRPTPLTATRFLRLWTSGRSTTSSLRRRAGSKSFMRKALRMLSSLLNFGWVDKDTYLLCMVHLFISQYGKVWALIYVQLFSKTKQWQNNEEAEFPALILGFALRYGLNILRALKNGEN